MPAVGFHELGRHAELASGAEDRAHEYPVDVGLSRHRPEVGRFGGEAGCGGARPDDDRLQPGERGRDRVREGERQEVDLRVGPQQAEGEDHEPCEGPGHRAGRRRLPRRDLVDLRRHLRRGGVAVGRPLGEGAAEHAVEADDGRVAGEGRRLLVQGGGEHLNDRRPEEGRPP